MLEKYIKSAKREQKADLVLKNATYADVFCGKLRNGDIAIVGEKIVGIGEYVGESEIDCSALTVLPAYIDGHVHIESSLLSPEGFASLIVPRGTTAVIADPHEITNVCGIAGCNYILKAAESVPLDVFLQLPSCVPATPFEASGSELNAADISRNIVRGEFFGLGEFMNYPAVISCDGEALKKLEAAHGAGKIIDGHAPSVTGYDLNAYLCGGISTDHECASLEEVEEKISKGMYVHIRHGSSTHNLGNAKAITPANMRRFILCTDDRHASDLKEKGHIDDALRRLVADGLNPIYAVTCATLNVAECYGLERRGGIAPFWLADLVIVDNLENFNAKYVIKNGKVVAENGQPLFDKQTRFLSPAVLNTVRVKELSADDFIMKINSDRAKAITLKAGGIVTDCETVEIKKENGDVAVKGTDLVKLAVVERHKMTGNIGKALLKGYGFKGGAMGLTVAHDSHNVIVLGDDNEAMAKVVNALKEIGGGMAVACSASGKVSTVNLDIAGLMSSDNVQSFQSRLKSLIELAHEMGVKREYEAFMSLAFLSLAVVPKLKITDKGLFDVEKFSFTDVEG